MSASPTNRNTLLPVCVHPLRSKGSSKLPGEKKTTIADAYNPSTASITATGKTLSDFFLLFFVSASYYLHTCDYNK